MNRNRTPLFSILFMFCSCLITGAAFAEGNPCGTLVFEEGIVRTSLEFPVSEKFSDDVHACVGRIAAEIEARREIRTVTVVARVTNEARATGAGLRTARAYAQTLVKNGVSEHRVSAVSPAIAPGEKATLTVTFTQKRAKRPVAVIESVSGKVTVGKTPSAMESASRGQTLSSYTYLNTGRSSTVSLTLADGSFIAVSSDTRILFGRMWLNEKLKREVRINLLEGNFRTDITKGGVSSSFDVVTPTGIAGVRGTRFRVGYDGKELMRLETILGVVELMGSQGTVWVKGGNGSTVDHSGIPTKPKKLLDGAEIVKPLKGVIPARMTLEWKPLKNAVSYRITVARDAEFTMDVHTYESTSPSEKVDGKLKAGKWYWRVIGVDSAGFSGFSSKVYSFEIKS